MNAITHRRPAIALLIVTVAMTLAACSGLGRREDDQTVLARYLDYAGEPVDQFRYSGRLNNWRPLSSDRAVVWTGVNDAYLLSLGGACPDLEFAHTIALTQRGAHVARGDYIRLPRGQRCVITEIRPVDYKALKQAEREARGTQKAEQKQEDGQKQEGERK